MWSKQENSGPPENVGLSGVVHMQCDSSPHRTQDPMYAVTLYAVCVYCCQRCQRSPQCSPATFRYEYKGQLPQLLGGRDRRPLQWQVVFFCATVFSKGVTRMQLVILHDISSFIHSFIKWTFILANTTVY